MHRPFYILLGIFFSVALHADPPDNRPPDNRPPGQGNGGANVQQQQQQQAISGSTSSSNATSVSGSTSNSGASAYNGGNNLSVSVQGPSGGASATGGSADATGGNAVAEGGAGGQGGVGGVGTGGAVGDTSSSSGGNSQSIDYNYPASSAASVYAGYCQAGGSGQTEDGGFSVVSSEQFCDHIRAAEEMLKAYDRVMQSCEIECVGICTDTVASVDMSCMEDGQAQYYLDAYHENLHDANALVQNTQYTGLIGRIANQLSIPIALVAAILFL